MSVLRGLCLAISLLFAYGSALAQDRPDVTFQCPALYLDAPQWPLTDGDTAKFTVRIEPKPPEWNLKYNWTLSSGKIISGQGTDSIVVERKIHYVDATVEIAGFPRDDICMRVASERATWSVLPVAEKIKTFQGSKLERKFELGHLVDLGGLKDHNLVVFMGFKKGASEETIRTRESEVLKEIGNRLERDRFELISVFDGAEATEFWKVPVGAKNPTCETCLQTPSIEKQDCPTISLSGPAGVTNPGDSFVFTSTVNGELPKGISYLWTVSEGDIVSGQGPSAIKVVAQWKTHINLTASLKIVGLADGCPSEFHETAAVACMCKAIFLDEFEISSAKIDRTRLDLLVGELRKDAASVGFIIEYFPSKTSQRIIDKKVEMIAKYLTSKGLRRDQFKIATEVDEMNRTKLYKVPPGAEFPNP